MKNITTYIKESYSNWNWEDEADKDGKIKVTTSQSSCGGRENDEVDWELEMLSDEGDYWEVRATVVRTDNPRMFERGWYIDFELYKNTSIFDIEYELLRAVEDERY